MKCLQDLIAITNNDCPCVVGNISPEDKLKLTYGKSGLSLDDLDERIGLSSLQYIDDCKDFKEICFTARDNAIRKLEADLLVMINSSYDKRQNKFIGEVGRISYSSFLELSKKYSFIRLRPKNQSTDAIITLKQIRLNTNQSGEVKLYIISAIKGNTSGDIIQTYEKEVGGGNFVDFQIDQLELPLVYNGMPMDYFIVWEREDGMNTKDNTLSCNCGGQSYENYIEAKGGSSDDLNNLSGSLDGLARGLSLFMEIECKAGNLICKEFDKDDAISISVAWALLYRTGISLVTAILSSNEVNRYTMLKKEHLMGIRNHYTKEYNILINWLKENININDSDCFICRDNSIFMTKILL